MSGTQPRTVDEVAAALDAAAPAQVEQGAAAFDEARRGLRALAGRLDRTLSDLDEAWRGRGSGGARLAEPLRRTRELVHMLDEGEFGRRLRIVASGLAAGQARVRDLRAQRIAGVTDVPFDQQAQQILQDVGNGYRDAGLAVGGQSPPAVSIVDPELGRALLDAAHDDSAPVTLAAADPAQMFRPVVPTLGVLHPGDPVLPPPAGGGPGGGAPMMPFMPPMGGMGGMGGMGTGATQESTAQKRSAVQGDPDAWGDGREAGWNVVGRRERLEVAREEFRTDFEQQIDKVTRGGNRGV